MDKLAEATCDKCGSTYLRHPRSRLNLCCRCRQARKAGQVIATPDRDLAREAIKSEAELATYLDHDELLCLICGSRHKGLYAHLRAAHHMSARDYKLRYGIPITCGLVGKATKVAMAASAEATSAKMAATGFKNLVSARASKGTTRVAQPRYKVVAQVARMVSSENHPSHLTGTDVLICRKCGGEVYVSASASLALQCRVLCDTCKG